MNELQDVTKLVFKDLMEDSQPVPDGNEMVELLDYYRLNGVPVTQDQAKAMFLLKEEGFDDIANYAFVMRPHMTKPKKFMELISKITMADRIRGNAKLSNLLKANVASTSQVAPVNPKDYEAKAMKKSELR